MRQTGEKEIRIDGGNCDSCGILGIQVFSIEDAPPIPNPDCTGGLNCFLYYKPRRDIHTGNHGEFQLEIEKK